MREIARDSFLSQIIRGIVAAIAIILVLVVAFSFVLTFAELETGVIRLINKFIKLAAIFCGVCSSVKNERGVLKGLIIGLSATILSFLLFGLIGGGVDFGLSFWVDILCGGVMGGLSGFVAVNLFHPV